MNDVDVKIPFHREINVLQVNSTLTDSSDFVIKIYTYPNFIFTTVGLSVGKQFVFHSCIDNLMVHIS